jgi:hypothetical protein
MYLLDAERPGLDSQSHMLGQILTGPQEPGFARPANGPRQRLKSSPDPSLRSGFRQRAPASLTPANRLNLLKKSIASTLTLLWKKRARLQGKPQAGRVHG